MSCNCTKTRSRSGSKTNEPKSRKQPDKRIRWHCSWWLRDSTTIPLFQLAKKMKTKNFTLLISSNKGSSTVNKDAFVCVILQSKINVYTIHSSNSPKKICRASNDKCLALFYQNNFSISTYFNFATWLVMEFDFFLGFPTTLIFWKSSI